MRVTEHLFADAAINETATARAVIDRSTSVVEVVRLQFKAALVDRGHAFVRSFSINAALVPMMLLPDDAKVVRCATTDNEVALIARCSLGMILVSAYPRSATVIVAAASDGLAQTLEAQVRRRVPQDEAPETVSIRTWNANLQGAYRSADRRISVPRWSTIERNYPTEVRRELTQLAAVKRPEKGGKLILWQGEPGTGKTTALRALLRQWEPWCSGQYIADPERFFSDPGYIAEVLTRPTAATHGPTLTTAGNPESVWRLVVAEDSDEYLRASARRDAGAGLGRLLNLADGVLGQGFNALILLTTNEELHRIHPALTRPGRCLARVEFTPFSPAEARSWLPPGSVPPDRTMSLAELYEQAGELDRIGHLHPAPESIGQYL